MVIHSIQTIHFSPRLGHLGLGTKLNYLILLDTRPRLGLYLVNTRVGNHSCHYINKIIQNG